MWRHLRKLLSLPSRQHIAAAGIFAGALAIGSAAQAQTSTGPTLNLQRFEPSGSASGFVTTPTARFLPEHRFGFDFIGSYGWRTLQIYENVGGVLVHQEEAMEHLAAIHLRAAVAPTPWLQIALRVPVLQIANTGLGFDDLGGNRDRTLGVGDTTLEVGLRALPESYGVGLAFIPFMSAPTGTRDLYLTHGIFTFGSRMALSGSAGPVYLAGHVGYRVKVGSAALFDNYAVDDEILYGAGFGVQFVPGLFRVNAEANGATTVGPGLQNITRDLNSDLTQTAVELHGNLQFTADLGLVVMLGAGGGLTPAPGNPGIRGYFSMGYAPPTAPDADGDGIPNSRDACKKEAEDFDDYADDDGCPDPDNDDDGLLDTEDSCPEDPEDDDGFEDDDGCPDRDNDLDRIADLVDACPDEPEDRDRFEDDDGCPDPDNDGDTILDADDKCPDVAEDFDGFSDDDGCPEEEYDRDADGYVDELDACPDAAEDFDNYVDEDGCPEPDNDLDGIADLLDLCPNEPEEFNGFADDDGCPDEVKAVLQDDRIVILEKVMFYVDDDRIREDSYGVLDAVVATMLENPQVTKVRVEGHTDAQGSDEYNQSLSERRALSVRRYLVEHGVEPDRLVAEGYGEMIPIAPNRTAEGRELNRRVEFIVVEPAAQ